MDDRRHESGLRKAFRKASDPLFGRIGYLIQHYPSKSAAATAAAADALFLVQSIMNNNYLGVFGATIGLLACQHLYRYGDPKVRFEEAHTFIDPQDRNTVANWIKNPEQYPWECAALMRAVAMSAVLLGGANVGDLGGDVKYGEIMAASLSLAGFGVKIAVAERAKGSVLVPDDKRGLAYLWHNAKAYVYENPNPTAGILFNSALVALAGESILRQEWAKLGSALFYVLPNSFNMFSSKRAQISLEHDGLR